jgi:hypothetical protein
MKYRLVIETRRDGKLRITVERSVSWWQGWISAKKVPESSSWPTPWVSLLSDPYPVLEFYSVEAAQFFIKADIERVAIVAQRIADAEIVKREYKEYP